MNIVHIQRIRLVIKGVRGYVLLGADDNQVLSPVKGVAPATAQHHRDEERNDDSHVVAAYDGHLISRE